MTGSRADDIHIVGIDADVFYFNDFNGVVDVAKGFQVRADILTFSAALWCHHDVTADCILRFAKDRSEGVLSTFEGLSNTRLTENVSSLANLEGAIGAF